MGRVNFDMNSKRNFPKHMSCPAFTRTSNDEPFVNNRERLNCKFLVRYNWFAKFMIHKIKRFNFEFSKSLQYSLRKNFYSVSTRLRECHRVNLITQTTGISRKFTALFLSLTYQKELLKLSVHNLSFLRNFEFSKSLQYLQSYNFFFLNHSLAYMSARELNYADNSPIHG